VIYLLSSTFQSVHTPRELYSLSLHDALPIFSHAIKKRMATTSNHTPMVGIVLPRYENSLFGVLINNDVKKTSLKKVIFYTISSSRCKRRKLHNTFKLNTG